MERTLLRRVFGTIAAGFLAGATAGIGARLVMRVIQQLAPSYRGQATHAGAVNGRLTIDGTLNLTIEGAVYGVAGAVLFLLVRRWLPRQPVVRGLLFSIIIVSTLGGQVLDPDNYEFVRYISPYVALGLFSLLFPIYAVVLAVLARRFGADPPPVPPVGPALMLAGRVILLVLATAGITRQVGVLSRVEATAPALIRVAPAPMEVV